MKHRIWSDLHTAACLSARFTCSLLVIGLSGLNAQIGAHMARQTRKAGLTGPESRIVQVPGEAARIYYRPPERPSDTQDGPN